MLIHTHTHAHTNSFVVVLNILYGISLLPIHHYQQEYSIVSEFSFIHSFLFKWFLMQVILVRLCLLCCLCVLLLVNLEKRINFSEFFALCKKYWLKFFCFSSGLQKTTTEFDLAKKKSINISQKLKKKKWNFSFQPTDQKMKIR